MPPVAKGPRPILYWAYNGLGHSTSSSRRERRSGGRSFRQLASAISSPSALLVDRRPPERRSRRSYASHQAVEAEKWRLGGRLLSRAASHDARDLPLRRR